MDKRTILLVDDEREFVKMMTLGLQMRNYQVSAAYDGEEALEKVKANPDIILLDVMLPKINGYEVCRRLREDEATHRIPIIMLTGRDISQDKIEGLYIGADDYITKPFETEELFARIEAILRRGQSFEEREKDKKLAIDEIKRIINDELIIPHFQPIFYLQPFRLLGIEVLSRLPQKCYFGSTEILFDAAFYLGTLLDLEMACHKKALSKLGKNAQENTIFFNISPYLVLDPKFRSAASLYSFYTHPEKVVLELTERTAIKDFDLFVQTLMLFKKEGFKISIDDIGSGYASLNSIVEIKPNFIKIDMPIIRNIEVDSVRQNLLKAIVMFCKESGFIVIAEGIEKQEELETLICFGVDAGQGYLLGRPSPDVPK